MKIKYLPKGEYTIPKGCMAVTIENRLFIKVKREKYLKEGEYRCKDCAHVVKGRSMKSNKWMSDVCLMRPKCVDESGQQYYYAILKYGKPCDKFKKR